jgi:hypothetical protein
MALTAPGAAGMVTIFSTAAAIVPPTLHLRMNAYTLRSGLAAGHAEKTPMIATAPLQVDTKMLPKRDLRKLRKQIA